MVRAAAWTVLAESVVPAVLVVTEDKDSLVAP
jgi:hypothetical protein